ncbi:hypothetical protein OUZ56_016123 [Daphnia magna]|uniref:Uncharacterized protein n=1 Tax=Daphnia magna TaxID=35525 RepID=A0ABR0APR1_9CRUS|nr:hypothetical protein OUZ56_016123 [Daphnia magna]
MENENDLATLELSTSAFVWLLVAMFVLFFSYLWRLRVWVFKEYIQNGFVFFRLNREYKSRFQQFTARWQLLFFSLILFK